MRAKVLNEAQVEVLSLVGNIALDGLKPKYTLMWSWNGATAVVGHLLEACGRPTLEGMIVDSPAYLRRVRNPDSGVEFMQVDESASRAKGIL